MSAAFGRNGEPAEAHIKLRSGANGRTRRVLIPTGRMIEDYVHRIPFGTAPDIAMMKKEFAQAAGADLTCPVTTRLHLRAVCELAVETRKDGGDTAPVWRLIGPDDMTARRVAGAADMIRDMRARENI
jgi:hypothetical protein